MRKGWSLLFSSIRSKILLSFFICIIVPVAFIIYNAYSSSQEVLRKQIEQSNEEAMLRAAANMDGLSERMMNASNLIVNDPELQYFLQSDPDWTGDYTSFQRYQNIQTKLSNIKDIIMDSDAIVAVIDFRGYVHASSSVTGGSSLYSKLVKEPWFQSTLQENGWPHWQLPYEGALNGEAGEGKKWFVLSRLIQSSQGNEGIGIALIGIPSASFFPGAGVPDGDAQQNTLLLTTGDHQVLDIRGSELPEPADRLLQTGYGQEGGGTLTKITLADRDYLYNSVRVPRLGWELVELVPQSELMTQLNRSKNRSFVWLFGWFAVFTVVFICLMLRFTSPIRALLISMSRLGLGDFNSQVAVKGNDEIAKLATHYNRMIGSLQELIVRLSDEQKRKEEARFQALQAQINPHFLFNTLNSIKWMAMLSGAQHVSQMLTRLGKLLEFTMKNDREVISLEEEFARLEDYLDLQKIRFHDNVLIDVRLPEELKHSGILKFTLQPIVENSIIHGNRTPLRIGITAAEVDGVVEIAVEDNGKGMDENKLEELRHALGQNHARYNGIGISNVNERLRMHYGSPYGIDLRSIPGEGTTVTIRIPHVLPE